MRMAKKMKTILAEREMTIQELSNKLGYEGSYLYNKLSRDQLTEEELKKIADALNYDYNGIFTFRDTGKIIYKNTLSAADRVFDSYLQNTCFPIVRIMGRERIHWFVAVRGL